MMHIIFPSSFVKHNEEYSLVGAWFIMRGGLPISWWVFNFAKDLKLLETDP